MMEGSENVKSTYLEYLLESLLLTVTILEGGHQLDFTCECHETRVELGHLSHIDEYHQIHERHVQEAIIVCCELACVVHLGKFHVLNKDAHKTAREKQVTD